MENQVILSQHLANIKLLLAKNEFPQPLEINRLKSSGSNRIYFRIDFKQKIHAPILAAFNADIKENKAWHEFTQHFLSVGFAVPEIYAHDENFQYFLLQDLGDLTLFDQLKYLNQTEIFNYYKKVITDLINFQVDGIKGLNLEMAYPAKKFEQRSILWDLNYFKYYFIKTHELGFDENKLETEFQHFSKRLVLANTDFFQYRDFQARNIMINENKLFYIDFQGGRKGPLQYDLVSLLFQAKANLKQEIKDQLLDFYLEELEKKLPDQRIHFLEFYNDFIYFRLMQVLGAYGFRGLIQKKTHFLQSIPFAIENLKNTLENYSFPAGLPEMMMLLQKIVSLDKLYPLPATNQEILTVKINSFSFLKSGYPSDTSENGGGFVFDCRGLPNPGKIAELRNYSGLEKPVMMFFEKNDKMKHFLHPIFSLIDQSVESYLGRHFKNLQVNFGCTGGKHRSVYSAEQLKNHLSNKYRNKVNVIVHHEMRKEW